MNTITLPFNWSEAKNSAERYVTSKEGIAVDLLTLTKVELNGKLEYDGDTIYFSDEQVVKNNKEQSIKEFLEIHPLRLKGVGIYKSHCVIYGFNKDEELLNVSFTDNLLSTNVVSKMTLRTFGYSQEEILSLIESTGSIKRACKDAFVIINREGFYDWLGEELLTRDLFIEKIKAALNKKTKQ